WCRGRSPPRAAPPAPAERSRPDRVRAGDGAHRRSRPLGTGGAAPPRVPSVARANGRPSEAGPSDSPAQSSLRSPSRSLRSRSRRKSGSSSGATGPRGRLGPPPAPPPGLPGPRCPPSGLALPTKNHSTPPAIGRSTMMSTQRGRESRRGACSPPRQSATAAMSSARWTRNRKTATRIMSPIMPCPTRRGQQHLGWLLTSNFIGYSSDRYARTLRRLSMNIVVLVKQVPDSGLARQLDAQLRVDRNGANNVMGELDEYAVEAALQLKEAHGGEVTVLTLGPDQATETVRKALAMGADKALHVSDEAVAGSDALATSKILAAALGRLEWDLVIAGAESTDSGMGV